MKLTLAQVVDSARLAEEMRQLPGRPAAGTSLFAIVYDSTGVVENVLVLGRASAVDSAAVATLRRLATPQLERRAYEHLLVRTEWGAAPVVAAFNPRKERAPELQNRLSIASALSTVGSRFAYALRPQGEMLELRIHVDAEGNPMEIIPSRTTGLPDLDRAVMEVARRVRFRPAMLDDIPVKVWATMPITIMPAPVAERARMNR